MKLFAVNKPTVLCDDDVLGLDSLWCFCFTDSLAQFYYLGIIIGMSDRLQREGDEARRE